jgi:hypothetical protein
MGVPSSLPEGLRLAQPGDQKRLFDLCMTAYEENGWGDVDPEAVRETIEGAVWHDNSIFGIVPGPERIEAALGLYAQKTWYGGDGGWFWSELMFYVHPKHRRSGHDKKLSVFAEWWSAHASAPVVISLMPRERMAAKERLFTLRGGKRIGGIFVFGDPTFRYMADAA